MSLTMSEIACRYCLPMGARSKSYCMCDRHTTLFKKLDAEIFGTDLTNRLARLHNDRHSMVLVMTTDEPKAKSGEAVGEIIDHELIGRRNHWTVRDLNDRLWMGSSMRRDLVRFYPVELDSEGEVSL
jgi:hypothetical protein